MKDIVNSHLNNPFISTSSQTIDGWTVDCTNGHWNLEGTCLYDWTSETGSISTTLYGGGRAILNFGNCWTGYAYVTVELGKDSQSITKNMIIVITVVPQIIVCNNYSFLSF